MSDSPKLSPVKLDYPLEVGGRKYEAIELRRPKSRDIDRMEKFKGTGTAKAIKLFADLADLPTEVFEEMVPSDLGKLNDAIEPFLPPLIG